jgi:hypothetical protein
MALAFRPTPPLPLPTAPVPPLAEPIGDYCFAYDRRRARLIYAPTPEAHQLGVVHAFDGETWTELPSAHYRLGSQRQPWRALWDPRREAVVAWSFDGKAPVGVVVGAPDGEVIGEEGTAGYGDQPARRVITGGDHPRRAATSGWDNLVGIFAVDEARGVTVCLTADAVHELDGATWRRCADAAGLPAQAEGQTSYGFSAGFGGAWDPAGGRVLFWMHDGDADVPRFFAWKDGALAPLAAAGLPEDAWGVFGDKGYAVGPHPRQGLVVWVGPEQGWFVLDGDGFVALPAPVGEAPPRVRAGQIGCHEARGLLVLGPTNLKQAPQRVFHVGDPATGRWRRMGASAQKCVLADLSSGPLLFGLSEGAMVATSLYLKTARHGDAEGWQVIVDEKAGDAAREGQRAVAACTAWGGRLHALMSDGGLLRLEEGAWRRAAAPDEAFTAAAHPLLAFDEARGLLVCWGPDKKTGGRKDETWVHDGTAWTKVKKGKAKVAKAERFDLLHAPALGGVIRLGGVELAVFDGKDWTTQALAGEGIDVYHRCVGVAGAALVVLDPWARTLLRIDGGRVVKVGAFEAPMARKAHDNTPFDHPWFDPIGRRFVAHCADDDRCNVELALD